MSDNKMVQVIFRVTKEEKEAISEKAQSRNISVNQFIKNCIFENEKISDSTIKEDDSKYEQIKNLQTIIYNRDTKLLETSTKHWWQFWR